ncbi:recombinase family protein [Rossellomorea marisflavi]|uniref:recombinase family protein n=1 Tax=Rossellomorea marisflavi TaxID=189381 RepID=UPI00292A4761|nr:recombinase family protein [Rossellomorea marisflavi]
MRVSTKDQSLELPKDGLKKYGVEGIYAEKEPGGKWDRPGDTLVVYKLDRLARSQKQLIEIADRLRQEDVELVSISEQLDMRTEIDKAMFGMSGVVAELERNIFRERTAAGLATARARGRRGGRPKMNTEKNRYALSLYDAREMTI